MNIRANLIGIFFILVTNNVFAEKKVKAIEGVSLSAKIGDILRKTEPQLSALNIKGSATKADLKKLNVQVDRIKKDIEKASSGGVDTGGGTLVKTNHGIGLLDLYLYNPEAFDDQRIVPSNILESDSLKSLGIDLILNKKNTIVSKTLAQIEKWRSSSPIVTDHLTKALQNLPFYYHQGYLANAPIEYFLPQNRDLAPSDLRMVAIYIKGFGVHIGFEDFRDLPETHQIALVIHECLRLMSATGNFSFSNETLQRLTAEIMSEPKKGQSLDRPEYLHGQVLASLLEVVYLAKKAQFITSEICANPPQQQSSELCSLNVEEVSFEALSELLSNYFGFLYGKTDHKSNNEKTQNLLSELYLFTIQTENLHLKWILNEAIYSGSYMNIRSRSMEIDSAIDIENSYGLNFEEAERMKKRIKFYLQDAKVEPSKGILRQAPTKF